MALKKVDYMATCTPAKREKGVTQNPDGHASKGDEKHERTVQRRVHGLGRARNVDGYIHHPGWRRLFWSQRPKGHLHCISWPLGEREVRHGVGTDTGVLLEAKPVAPVETTRTPRVRVVATSGGGGFGKQRMLFAKLSHRTMLFLSRTLKRLQVY